MSLSANLFSKFAEAAQNAPERTFIQSETGVFSYSDMLDGSAAAVGALRAMGVQRGQRVLVQVDKSVNAVFLYLGCLRSNIIFIPLNTAYTEQELDYFIKDAEPALLVCSEERRLTLTEKRLVESELPVLTLEADGSGSFAKAMREATPELPIAACDAQTTAAILYTSGTTGRSKGAMLTHGNLSSNVTALDQIWAWEDDDVLLHALPIFHAHGLFVALHCAMFRASTILFHSRFDVGQVVHDLKRATVFMGVPTFYVRLLKHDAFNAALAAGLRLFVSGSAPLTETVFEAFETRTGKRILERYGMTEALMITSNPYLGERIAGSVGYPLPGVTVRVEGSSAREEQGPGILEIKGANVFKGYWRNPEKTGDAFTNDGFFRTGDIARIASDGRVTLVGRSTDLVISGGYNIYPKEIEVLIDELEDVEESAVVGVPHPDFGEAVVAIVVPRRQGALDPAQISDALRNKLAAFKQPKQVLVVDELPRNAMGKVEKAVLRSRYKGLFTE